ncbi:MAG: S1 RNA-binding domain-containing protein [Bacteroidota bacterium]
MIHTGKYNTLKINRFSRSGVFLDDGEGNEILLPQRYVKADMEPGASVRVFVYNDSEDRPVAVTDTPAAEAGQLALLSVMEIANAGAFLDWGLPKDLLVPFGEQQERMVKGKSYLVYILVDPVTGRLMGSTRLNRYLGKEQPALEVGEQVELVVVRESDIGYHVAVESRFWGILYRNEVFEQLSTGTRLQGFVKLVRPDGKIDCTLQSGDENRLQTLADKILQLLQENEGFLELGDHSSPEEIRTRLKESKKMFKKAVGLLYRQKKILIETRGLRKT